MDINTLGVVRKARDIALGQTDIYCLSDRWSSLTAAQQSELSIYRQALRDLPGQDLSAYAIAAEVPFPSLPSFIV